MLNIIVNIGQQRLYARAGDDQSVYPIATAKNGIGQLQHSECTPLGRHVIAEKIGHDCAINTVFVGRCPTGEQYHPALAEQQPDRDWILTRILWLQGLEPGFNQGYWHADDTQLCDTYQRYIYIHGCPDSHPMQHPSSHGCIKMRNRDVVELFEQVVVGTPVLIVPE